MLGIYSLIWTICHKLMWFYRNTVLFHIIFVVTLGEIFGHLGHTGPLTVKTKWRCRRCIGEDCVVFLLLLKEIRLQLSHKASQQVLLQHVSHTAETDKVSLVLWSTVSQNLRPLGAARTMWVYFALCQQSTLKSQGASYIRGSSYIRDKTVVSNESINAIHQSGFQFDSWNFQISCITILSLMMLHMCHVGIKSRCSSRT